MIQKISIPSAPSTYTSSITPPLTPAQLGKSSAKRCGVSKGGGECGEDVPYVLSRYVPPLKQLVEALVDGRLDEDHFQYLGSQPRMGRRTTDKKKKALKSAYTRKDKTTMVNDDEVCLWGGEMNGLGKRKGTQGKFANK